MTNSNVKKVTINSSAEFLIFSGIYSPAHLGQKTENVSFVLESHSQFSLGLESTSPNMKLHMHLNRELWSLPNLIKWL